jgi:hypothetical protein
MNSSGSVDVWDDPDYFLNKKWVPVPTNLEYLTESVHPSSLEALKKRYPEWAKEMYGEDVSE